MAKTMPCAFCGKTKAWPVGFVSSTYAECLACWLRPKPEKLEAMRQAVEEVMAERAEGERT